MGRLQAFVYDRIMRDIEAGGAQRWRHDLLADLEGEVLEVGAGTGANLAQYPATVTRLVLSEPDPHMRRKLERRLADEPPAPAEVEVVAGDADDLPFPDASFDAVVSTLVLCTVPDQPAALAEVERVLRPGGRFAYLEHVAATHKPDRLKWQRRIEPIWKHVAGGCRLTRTTGEAIDERFEAGETTAESLRKASPLMRFTVRGTATKPAA